MEIFIIPGIAFSILFLILLIKYRKTEKRSHKWRVKSAKRAMNKIRGFNSPGQIFGYLRKIDPFVFEEMVLMAIDGRSDSRVIRANRYTGDGGIDGTFTLNENGKKRKVLIQAKRYSNHINKKHVEEFCLVLDREKADIGLFVHTGRTGVQTKGSIRSCERMRLISGEKMIALLMKGEF